MIALSAYLFYRAGAFVSDVFTNFSSVLDRAL